MFTPFVFRFRQVRLGISPMTAGSSALVLAVLGACPIAGIAQTIPGLAPSLKTVDIAYPTGLLDGPQPIVVDKEKAIVLGKALFWDMSVGSDGVACATCHFHAGADSRTKNQFSPGKAHLPAAPTDPNAFDPIDERGPSLANYPLTKADFPLHRFGDPSRDAPLATDFVSLLNPKTHNTVSSAGTFSGTFLRVSSNSQDVCTPLTGIQLDQTFNVGGIHTRRVEPRNTPTIINAILFDRNFWDGRASHIFNGVSASGARDPNAFIWVYDGTTSFPTRLALENASLASQAVAPVTNEFEMSCRGRTFKDVARKLLSRRPLEKQSVHAQDSVLGSYRRSSGKGLNTTYLALIQQAFASRYWAQGPRPAFGKPPYSAIPFSQMEANFSMFFGLAVQLYAATLISDDSPFDRADLVVSPPLAPGEKVKVSSVISDLNGSMTRTQLDGLQLFVRGLCNECHTGPLFSSAINRNTVDRQTGQVSYRSMVDRQKKFFDAFVSLQDVGYFNNAAVPSPFDAGLGGTDEFGHSLAYAEQYLQGLAGHTGQVSEPLPLAPACNFQRPFTVDFVAGELIADPLGDANCANPALAMVPAPDIVAAALAGAADSRFIHGGHLFKTPQLYNVELTGPYMHNGGMATLEQAIDNYSRGGNFGLFNPDFSSRNSDKAGAVVQLRFTSAQRAALAEFLKALTDDRVRYQRAPFDHPQLLVPNGHPGDQFATTPSAVPGLAVDDLLEIPAVGRDGNPTPLAAFADLLPDN